MTTNADLFALGGRQDSDSDPRHVPEQQRAAELQRRVDAIIAEFGGPVPPATDGGFLDAERRLAGIRAALRALPVCNAAEEDEMVGPVLALDEALTRFLEDTPPPSVLAAAVKLREILVVHGDARLRQVLTTIIESHVV